MGILDGKVIFVSGGGEGMGRADVILALKEGAQAAFLEYKQENADGTVALAKSLGLPEPTVFMGNVNDAEFFKGAIASTVQKYGKIDCLVNNIGYFGSYVPVPEITDEEFDRVFDLNLKSIFHGCQYAIPYMKENGKGSIVNVASTAGIIPSLAKGVYGVAKAAVIKMTKDLAVEYAPYGIRVNCIAPGLIRTPLSDGAQQSLKDRLLANIPSKREGEANEIADAVIWLCSDRSSYVVGQIIAVDGGMTVRGT